MRIWEKATAAIIQACEELGLPYTVEEGEAAFYGPKLDFIVRDVLKREWQLGTVQVDYNLPERFELEYVAEDGSRQRPVMIHRAPFGSMERFIGILIEHFAGAFPAWLAPVQAMMIPITDRTRRVRQGGRGQTARRRNARRSRCRQVADGREDRRQPRAAYPLSADRGRPRHGSGNVSVRLRTDEDLGAMPVDQFVELATKVIDEKSAELQ